MREEDVKEIKYTPFTREGSIAKGSVKITFSNGMSVNGITLRDGEYGLWLAWPARPKQKQKQNDGDKDEWIPYISMEREDKDLLLKLVLAEAGESETSPSAPAGRMSRPYKGASEGDYI